MSLTETDCSLESSKEKFLCLLQCTSEIEAKQRNEPNLCRILLKYPHANSYRIHKQTGNKFK